jgi:hypothetical protein
MCQRVKREEQAVEEEEDGSGDEVVIIGEKLPVSCGDLTNPQMTPMEPRRRVERERGGTQAREHGGEGDDDDGQRPPSEMPLHRRAPRKAARESIKRCSRGHDDEEGEEGDHQGRETLGRPRRVVSCGEEFDDAVSKILTSLKKLCRFL